MSGPIARTLCLCHIVKSCKSKPRSFTRNSWLNVREAAEIRQDFVQEKYGKLLQENEPQGSYHPECYRRYTNREHLERLKNKRRSPRKRHNDSESLIAGPSPPKRRSSMSPALKEKDKLCFVCRKEKWMPDKKTKEKLLLCEDKSVENKIKWAAKVRNDQRNLLDIQGKDLIASEFWYHRSCYLNYTNPKVLERLEKSEAFTGSKAELLYGQAFNHLCDFIDEKVIDNDAITSLKTVKENYIGLLQSQGLEVMSYKMDKLKNRIMAKYGERVKFMRLSPNEPEYIFNANLDVSVVLANITRMEKSKNIGEPLFEESAANPGIEEDTSVYHCGIIIHKLISNLEDTLPWPPSASDICEDNIQVPDLLFNLLAYIITGTERPVYDSKGKLSVDADTNRQILSLGQDLINVVRKGQLKTVKNIGLGMAMRNITGNREAVTLLNRLGHCLSYNMLLKYEKALVKKYHVEGINSLILPQTIKPNVFASFVWDNNDICEETLTGAGTTHVTNGIIIQQEVSR